MPSVGKPLQSHDYIVDAIRKYGPEFHTNVPIITWHRYHM